MATVAERTEAVREIQPPLCVDLDGTLIKSDTVMDSLAILGRRHPLHLLLLPFWAVGGRARIKARLSELVRVNVATLPYNPKLIEYLETEHEAGREIYLATGADAAVAGNVADHLGLFHGVIASDGRTNVTGKNKLERIREHVPGGIFDYIGNAMPDLPVLAQARQAMLANPSTAVRAALRARGITVTDRFLDRPSRIVTLVRAIRMHQWAKNILVFLPILLAHAVGKRSLGMTAAAFGCFSLAASGTYILNDLLDIEADRLHPRKRRRAFASGDLSVPFGTGIALILLAASLAGAAFLPLRFLVYLLIYLAVTISYSLALKRIAILDVLILAGLYTLRVLAGAAATSTLVSPWLAAFAIFLFLSLAVAKRFSELENIRSRGTVPNNGRGYLLGDLEQLRSFGTASGYASIVVFALYINGSAGALLYRHPARMWLIVPLLILWLSRIWLLASRGELDEDPVVFALTDGMSLAIALFVLLVAWIAL